MVLNAVSERETSVAVMVTFTLKTDPATYEALHSQMLALAIPAGMLFHSAHVADGQVGIVDFWPDDAVWSAFLARPASRGYERRWDRSARRPEGHACTER